MKTKYLHNWNLSYRLAALLQAQLASKIRLCPLKKLPALVAGLDCAFSKDKTKIVACAVVLNLPELKCLETAYAVRKLTFPYIPGLLSFREAPACLAAVEKLSLTPDVFLIDGQGIAHPRRLGIASHLGLFFDRPTIGCAKSRLIGSFAEPARYKGSYTPLMDGDETIGTILRTRDNVKPLFVSVGHKCTLEDAIKIVLQCTTIYRLPEPTRLAHQAVSRLKLRF